MYHYQNPLQIFWLTGMVGRFGLVKPGNLSKFVPSCLVFGDIHKYFVGSAKTDLQPFLSGVLQGGSYVTLPTRNKRRGTSEDD